MENKNSEYIGNPQEFTLTPDVKRPQVNFYRKNVTTELSSDYTLPDYLPEIRKVLGISSKISPISRYIGSNTVEFSGHIDYDIIYIGSDGKLASAPLGADFSFDVEPDIPPYIDFENSNDAFADVETDMLHFRVTAPRKLNVKCRLLSMVRIYGYDDTYAALKNIEESEQLIKNIPAAMLRRYMSEVIELSDEISVNATPDNIKIISSNSNVNILGAEAKEKRLNCRGELISDILYENTENGELNNIKKKTPFEEEIEIDESYDSLQKNFNIKGTAGEIKMSVAENKLLLDSEIILEAEVGENLSINVIEDIYTPGHDCTTEYRDFKYDTMKKCGNATVVTNTTLPLSDLSLSSENVILSSNATVRIDSLSKENDKLCINGNCKIWILSKVGEEYTSCETNLPFDFDTGAYDEGEKYQFFAQPKITNCNCRIDGNNMAIEANIDIPYLITVENNMKIASAIKRKGEAKNSISGMTIYYPTNNERLWDIGKHFNTPLRRLAEANELSSANGNEILHGKNYIIVY